MKRLNLFMAIAITLFIVSCSSDSNKYAVSNHTDENGYSYETVANDPTGLRLYTLDNGLKVYLSQNNDEPTIQTLIPVRAGSTYDPKESTGLAHYLEHMVFKGTDKYGTSNWEEEKKYLDQISELYEKHRNESDPIKKETIYRTIDSVSYKASEYSIANEYDKMVASLGATGTNAGTSNELTVYMNKIPANELEKFLTLESEKFSKLVLRLFHTELEAVFEEFNRTQDSDGRKSSAAMMDGLFPTHPYGQQTTIGIAEHLKNPSLIEINAYFDKYYVPSNMAVILVGDFDFDKTIKMVDSTFGKMQAKEVEHPVLPVEQPLDGVVVKEVFGPSNENVTVAYRTDGVGTKDEKYITLIDMILANSSAGLMDLNLNKKQLVQRASSSQSFLNEYGYLRFNGVPKAGQSLDEVKELMLAQVELIKKGEFDDWMLDAVINDLKLSQTREQESAGSLVWAYMSAYIERQDWNDEVRFIDELREISKEDLIAFANDFFTDDYVLVYKRKGEDKNVVKVQNPGITPIQINRNQSKFVEDFNKIDSEEIKPLYVDYNSEIKSDKLSSGIEMAYIENKRNDLFNLNVIFDMGKDHDKKLALAVGYLKYLGTDKYSAEQLAKEFYKIGASYSVNTGSDRSYVSISGLQENLESGLELLEHLMSNAVVDQDAYDNYVASILKSRQDGKTQKGNILFTGLRNYSRYGENSRLRDIITAEDLRTQDPSELVTIIKGLNSYKHRIFYYGNEPKTSLASLNKLHQVPSELKDYPEPKKYEQLATGNSVNLVDFDMVQAEMVFDAKGQEFDPKKMALATVFNSYFGGGLSSIVFQEIRESKSLAYAAQAGYGSASKEGESDNVFAYIGTQANKLPQAVDAMMELMNNMPKSEGQFNSAKEAALKQIASQRITKSNIFWTYESLKRRGLDYDNREEMYKAIQDMTIEDVDAFFKNNVKGQDYSISVIGNKKDLDMKALEKLGEVHELDIDYLFNYTPTEIKK
ncbi:M16 family metallopeptidase [Urechidicola vernalis]|uniref:Insulinase family protein n=1 Tax=Urechidicola vernalis TaxID=3075600 RepID=A0ABU2Y0I1_9FLAO|nr:insulinase family protein [Urechidicola sp. P050]MDT0551658.1 insulinase family protein [Urechidicola sp. P050]